MNRIVHQVWAESNSGRGPRFVTAASTPEEAEEKMAEFAEQVKLAGGHNSRYWVQPKEVTTDFVIPSLPAPREKYSVHVEPLSYFETRVTVLRGKEVVGSYERNYPMLRTFEPFRQGGRDYALISSDYTATSVMDLQTGKIIASEQPDPCGFCPVGFYVPDWHDIHDGGTIPGSEWWDESYERPDGSFGFVWGCVWSDDLSVHYLDLSGIADGVIRRDDRFGYVDLATITDDPRQFIRYHPKTNHVTFAVYQTHSLEGAMEA